MTRLGYASSKIRIEPGDHPVGVVPLASGEFRTVGAFGNGGPDETWRRRSRKSTCRQEAAHRE